MDYFDKVNKLISGYCISIIINIILLILIVFLGIGWKVSLGVAICCGILSFLLYGKFQGNRWIKNVSFYILTIGVSFTMAMPYAYEGFKIGMKRGGGNTLSIFHLLWLGFFMIVLYLLIKALINNLELYKSVPLISIGLAIFLCAGVYKLSENSRSIEGIVYASLFFGVIFVSSCISILFLKNDKSFELILTLSYFGSFLLALALAISLIFEDGAFLEFFLPDFERKKKL